MSSFNTPDDDTDALGFLISNHLMRRAIDEEFETLQNVTLMDENKVSSVSTSEEHGTIQQKLMTKIHLKNFLLPIFIQ